MADDRSARALAAADRLFKRKPDATMEDFRKVCVRADKSVAKLSGRKFNAKYILPFRRSAAAQAKRTGRPTRRRTSRPSRTRGGKLTAEQKIARLVRERDAELLAAADDSTKVYQIASRVEEFAAELVKAAKK